LALTNGKARRCRQHVDLASLATPLQEMCFIEEPGPKVKVFFRNMPAPPALEFARDMAYSSQNPCKEGKP